MWIEAVEALISGRVAPRRFAFRTLVARLRAAGLEVVELNPRAVKDARGQQLLRTVKNDARDCGAMAELLIRGSGLLGYAGAVVMHGLWNGSALLGVTTYFLVHVLWMVPMFALAIILGLTSPRREQRVVAAKLPGMVAAKLVSANEAAWLASLRGRDWWSVRQLDSPAQLPARP